MEISLTLDNVFFILIATAIVAEFVDSYIGMLYGTMLTPILIICGWDAKIVVPAILFSQAMGGFIASYNHNKFGNAEFSAKSKDLKISAVIFLLGLIAVVVGALIGSVISEFALKLYIGILCIIMGFIVVIGKFYKFSWSRVIIIGLVSSFNKALSGGGFGPVVASGLIISGQKTKNSIGSTDFAEAPICIAAFIAWVVLNGSVPDMNLLVPLSIGAIIGGYFGPILLSYTKSNDKLKIILGIATTLSGIYMILKLYKLVM